MTTIKLFADDLKLSVVAGPKIASGNQKSVLLSTQFSATWEGYVRSAVFFTSLDRTAYEVLLDEDECVVPHEVLAKTGNLFIGVRGVHPDTMAVKPSTLVKYKIEQGAPVGDATAVEPTPDVYQQILEKLNNIPSESIDKDAVRTIVIEYLTQNPPQVDVANPEEIRNAVNQYLKENPPSAGVDFETDKTLILKDGILSVNATDQMEQDNTLPMTSAGVYATVGNIDVLLKTI